MRFLTWLLTHWSKTVTLARIDRELRAELELRREYAICGLPSPHQPQAPDGLWIAVAAGLVMLVLLSGCAVPESHREGLLRVTIYPRSVRQIAGWHLEGDDNIPLRDSGATVSIAGRHGVSFDPIPAYIEPAPFITAGGNYRVTYRRLLP